MKSGTTHAVIGDIHGRADRLESVLQGIDPSRHLVFLGDYIDRGPSSKLVIDILIDLKRSWNAGCTFLRGNHEVGFLRYISSGALTPYAAIGGLPTIKSYIGDRLNADIHKTLTESLPEAHYDFLDELVDYLESDDILFSHCGLDPYNPQGRSPVEMVLSDNPGLFDEDWSGSPDLVVCGHYVQDSGEPFLGRRLICLDTGCGVLPESPLTRLLLPEREPLTVS